MPICLRVAYLTGAAAFAFAPLPSAALSAPFTEDFEDTQHGFQTGATTSHQIGGGVSSYDWSVVGVSGDNVLRGHIFLHNLANDSASLVYTSQFISSANVAGSDFLYSVDVDISNIVAKVNDPEVDDHSMTIALGVLGSGAFSPGSFAGFKDLNDGQHYYLAVYTVRLGGDPVDPWASDSEGTLHLFEHGGDGQIDVTGAKSVKVAGGSFTFSIRGVYTGGALKLTCEIDGGLDPIKVEDNDSTPLNGAYFGFRSAAFSRSGLNASPDRTLDVDFDNVTLQKDFQPDASIAKGNTNNFKGAGIVNTSGSGQQAKVSVAAGDAANCTVRIKNSGTETDDISVTGSGSASGFALTYFDGNTNVTNQVVGSGYTLPGLGAGQSKNLKLRVQTSGGASGSKQFKVNARSAADPASRDTVKAKITIK